MKVGTDVGPARESAVTFDLGHQRLQCEMARIARRGIVKEGMTTGLQSQAEPFEIGARALEARISVDQDNRVVPCGRLDRVRVLAAQMHPVGQAVARKSLAELAVEAVAELREFRLGIERVKGRGSRHGRRQHEGASASLAPELDER